MLTGQDAYPAEATSGLVRFSEPLSDEMLAEAVVRGRKMAQKEQRLRPGVARPAGQSVAPLLDGTPLEVPKPTVGKRILRRFGGQTSAPRGPRPGSGAVPSTVGKRPLPDTELDGEPAILDAGAGMVWQIVGLERSDDYKFGATMDMV